MRLPKDYRCQASEVAVKHVGNGVLLLPVDDPWAASVNRLITASDHWLSQHNRIPVDLLL